MSKIIPITRKKIETTENPFWISYADLMTALVILFLVIMSISIVAISSRPIVEKQERDSDISAVFDKLEELAKEKKLELEINRTNHTISFGKQARFDSDSFQLSTEAQNQLRAFVPIMLEAKETPHGIRWLKQIHIQGFTDETGSYLYNVHLSLKRAEAVICALLSGKLSKKLQQQLQGLLIIDGASITGIKESYEESRRVEVRLEFRQPGDTTKPGPLPEMELGYCVIDPKYDEKKLDTKQPTAKKSTVTKEKKAEIKEKKATTAKKKSVVNKKKTTTTEKKSVVNRNKSVNDKKKVATTEKKGAASKKQELKTDKKESIAEKKE
ncbi:MAG: OmpA family protein [Magnetococcales bacterium]|nr:OmpA family protein [Magnetococcales bacterium]